MKATLYVPRGKGPFPGIVVLPGGNGAREVGRAWPHYHQFAKTMAERNLTVLVLDHASGEREFLDPRIVEDIGVAVDYLRRQDKVWKGGVFLVGFSMGGTQALSVAGIRQDIAGLVCYFSPVDWSIDKATAGKQIAHQPVEYASGVSCPVLILQGDRDEITPMSQAHCFEKALKSAGKTAKLVVYPGAGHGFTFGGAPQGKCCNYDPEIAARSFDEVERFVRECRRATDRQRGPVHIP